MEPKARLDQFPNLILRPLAWALAPVIAARAWVALSVVLLALIFAPRGGHAANVKTVKGSKALLDLAEDESAGVGDAFVIKGRDGSRKATLVVTAVKGHQAMCEIRTGEAKEGDEAISVDRLHTEGSSDSDDAPRIVRRPHQPYKAITGGIGLNNHRVKLTSAAEVVLNGTSFFVRTAYGVPSLASYERFGWEAGFSVEQINSTGTISTSACKGSFGCEFESFAITPFGVATYSHFGKRYLESHLRTGIQMLVPITLESNVIDANTFTPLMFGSIGVGARYPLASGNFIPLNADFAFYIGNPDVNYYRLLLNAGYAW